MWRDKGMSLHILLFDSVFLTERDIPCQTKLVCFPRIGQKNRYIIEEKFFRLSVETPPKA